jgi:WD40 repeat protein
MENDGALTRSLGWDLTNRFLAIGRDNGDVLLYDMRASEWDYAYRHECCNSVTTVAWCPTCRLLAYGGMEGDVYVYEYGDHYPESIYRRHQSSISALAWIDEDTIVSSAGKQVHIWKVSEQEYIGCVPGLRDNVNAIAVKDNKIAIAVGREVIEVLWVPEEIRKRIEVGYAEGV